MHAAIADTAGTYDPKFARLDRPPRDVISTVTLLAAAIAILDNAELQGELVRLTYKRAHSLKALEKIWGRCAPDTTPELHETLVAALTAYMSRFGDKHGLHAILHVIVRPTRREAR